MEPMEVKPGRTKMYVLTGTILSAVTTIAVSLIGIIPQLQGEEKSPDAPLETPHLRVEGRLVNDDGDEAAPKAEVILLPADSFALNQADAVSFFLFERITKGGYTILVRHDGLGLNERVNFYTDGTPDRLEVPLPGSDLFLEIDLKPET